MTRAAKEQSTYCAVRREGPQNVAEAGPGALHGQEPFEPRDPYGPEKP